MSQNIIRFFNDFAATFPSDKSAEKAVFEQNISAIFNRELNLVAAMYKDKKANLKQGSILLWEDVVQNTVKCGIMLATGKVLAIEEGTTINLPNTIIAVLEPTDFLKNNTNVFDIIRDKSFIGSDYEKVYDSLYKNSPKFRDLVKPYEKSTDFQLLLQNKNFPLSPSPISNNSSNSSNNNILATVLGKTDIRIVSDALINNTKIVKEGDALVYMYKSGEKKNINGEAHELNNIGRALSLVHELIHANILTSKPSISLVSDEEKQHSFIAIEKRKLIIDILLQWIDSQPTELNLIPLLPSVSVSDEIIDAWLGSTAINKQNIKFICNYCLDIPNLAAVDAVILTKYKDDLGLVSITNRIDIPPADNLILSKYALKLSVDLISWYGVLRNMEGVKFICNYALLRYLNITSTDATIISDTATLNLYKTGNGHNNIRAIPVNDYNVLIKYADRINTDIDTIIYFEI